MPSANLYIYIKQEQNIIESKITRQDVVECKQLSCNDYRVATLLKSYLTAIRIIMQSLKSIGEFLYV